jgi:hypothetical protein
MPVRMLVHRTRRRQFGTEDHPAGSREQRLEHPDLILLGNLALTVEPERHPRVGIERQRAHVPQPRPLLLVQPARDIDAHAPHQHDQRTIAYSQFLQLASKYSDVHLNRARSREAIRTGGKLFVADDGADSLQQQLDDSNLRVGQRFRQRAAQQAFAYRIKLDARAVECVVVHPSPPSLNAIGLP